MKKLLLIFITLITLTNVSYASFPITENNTELTTINFEEDEEDEEFSSLERILLITLFIGALGVSLFFGIRAWVKEFRKRRWVRIVTITIFSIVLLFVILASLINYGYSGG